MTETQSPLAVDRLRPLTLDAQAHPRGQAHIAAASGLVCVHGRAYVIGDDEQQLAVYADAGSVGELHRIVAGKLPRSKAARKKRKPDFESLFLLNAGMLVALGSGSRPTRERGALVALNSAGIPLAAQEPFQLGPLYEPLRARLGSLNIEGAFMLGNELVLLQRGLAHDAGGASMSLHYRPGDIAQVIDGSRSAVHPYALRPFALGELDGVPLAFTDGCALPGGGWAFTAVAEDSDGSYADGPCCGSAVGLVDANGELQSLRRLAEPHKVEGIAALADGAGVALFMVTDADDPNVASWLLSARL